MISLSPQGSIAALCRGGRLLIAAGGETVELTVADDAMAVAFDDQVWIVEVRPTTCRLSRYNHMGELLGARDVRGGGAPAYVRAMPAAHCAAIVGLSNHTFTATLDDGELVIVEQVAHPAEIVPAQRTVHIKDGQALLAGRRGANLLHRPGLEVTACWPLMRGALLAIVGADQNGPAIDVVSVSNPGRGIRLRVGADVLITATRTSSKLVMVDGRTLTVYDVVKRRFLMSRELRKAPIAIAVDARGDLLATDSGDDTIELVQLGRAASSTSHRDAHRAASRVAAATEVPDDRDRDDRDDDDDDEPTQSRRVALLTADNLLASMINGDFVDGTADGEIERRSPFDPDDVIGAYRYAASDVAAAVSAANEALPRWGSTHLGARLSVVRRFEAELRARAEDLVDIMVRESGRPRWECTREVRGLVHRIEYTSAQAAQLFRDAVDSVTESSIRRRPWGVVAVIGPAMLTLATSHQHIVAALLAGNTIVWKPSPLTAATAHVYTDALRGADAPAGVVNAVFGPDETGAELASHADVNCVVFTGSRPNGSSVRDRWTAAPSKQLVLHLGARNSAIVTADSVLALAGYELATSAFISAGQRCTAIRQVFADREIATELVTELRATCRALRVGGPDEGVFMGPMLSEQRLDDFQSALAAATTRGAKTVVRGERLDRPGSFLTPSVYLIDRPSGPAPEDSELFGPALFVHPVDSVDEAIARANAGADGLCAAVFTESDRVWQTCADRLEVGNVLQNMGTHSISGRLPFGGIKGSGLGGRAGGEALATLTRTIAMQERTEYVLDIWPGSRPPAAATPLSDTEASELKRRDNRRAPRDET